MRFPVAVAAVIACLSTPIQAASLVGTWQTEPDAKAQTGHVKIGPCGAMLCGTVISAFDSAGRRIMTPSVGRQILWNISVSGSSGAGRVYVPIMSADFPVQLNAVGNRLNLRACNSLGICRTQTWTRAD